MTQPRSNFRCYGRAISTAQVQTSSLARRTTQRYVALVDLTGLVA